MGKRITSVIAILCIFATAGVVQAQSEPTVVERKRTYSKGSSTLGSKTVISTRLEQKTNRSGVDGNIRFKARLFKKEYEAFRFHAVSEVNGGSAKNAVSFYAASFKVWSKSKSFGWKWTPSYNQTFLNKSRGFWIGGFRFSATGRVGGTVYGGLKLSANATGAGAQGKIGSYLWADVTCGLDLLFYRAGIQARATISHGWWQADSTLTFNWGIQGEFSYNFKAIKIDLKLVIQKAKFKWKRWKLRRYWKNWKSVTIASWGSKAEKKVYLSW